MRLMPNIMERRITEEIVREQICRGLTRELQAWVQARGSGDLEELCQCIREYQLQHVNSSQAEVPLQGRWFEEDWPKERTDSLIQGAIDQRKNQKAAVLPILSGSHEPVTPVGNPVTWQESAPWTEPIWTESRMLNKWCDQEGSIGYVAKQIHLDTGSMLTLDTRSPWKHLEGACNTHAFNEILCCHLLPKLLLFLDWLPPPRPSNTMDVEWNTL